MPASEPYFLSPLMGSFSKPAAENPTVAVVEASFRAQRYPGRYLNCEIAPENLADAVRGARAQGWLGFNCSLPHKVQVIELLDELAESASLIGAVNCVRIADGRLIGENTDGRGFVEALREVTDPAGKRLFVMGAGGASRAICVEAALAGAIEITITNRPEERQWGEGLAELVATRTSAKATFIPWDGPARVPAGVDVVVQATSVGLFPDVDAMVDIDLDTLLPEHILVDVIPNPLQTRLIAEANARGVTTVDGRRMLVNQAALNVGLWTGVMGDKDAMNAAYLELLGS